MSDNNQITLVQSPIIKHKLEEVGKSVSKRIDDLDLDKQIATTETVKSLKTLRAELNSELKDFESQRKFIKEGVNKPYLEFENIYKTEISEKYKSAIDTLKDKIAIVEYKIKSDKKEAIIAYFNELCLSEKIDFISFEKLGIEPNLSTSEKKYKEQVYTYISKINDDLNLIKTTDYEAEILTEYKISLNVSEAITNVKTRKENEAREKARLKAERIQKRKNELTVLEMRFVDITNAYEYNADIYMTVDDIENLSEEDFRTKISKCAVKINEAKSKVLEKETPKAGGNNVVAKPGAIRNEVKPVSAPKVIAKAEPLKTASFEVVATMAQLRSLGDYMRKNNIKYKNI